MMSSTSLAGLGLIALLATASTSAQARKVRPDATERSPRQVVEMGSGFAIFERVRVSRPPRSQASVRLGSSIRLDPDLGAPGIVASTRSRWLP